MSRSTKFFRNLFSSYASIAVNIGYTIASVPLALHYLTKEEFGIWALVTQLAGYLMLLEMGMVGSVARSLIDHKDKIEDNIYGSILRTGSRVFAIQGFLVLLIGVLTAWYAPSLLNLPPHLHHPFGVLMGIQAILNGAKLAAGSLASPLWCHQRLDISHGISSVAMVITLLMQWIGFHLGWNLYSLSIATTAGFIAGLSLTYIACKHHRFYPPKEHRGRFDLNIFRELFRFGGGLFLINLGGQLTSASQVIIVSRIMGIEAATTWSIATKIFTMAQQFVYRILDSSAGGLAEMASRQEKQLLYRRFSQITLISAVTAFVFCAGIALVNGPFIELWTSGRVTWNPWNNVLLGMVLFSNAVIRCHTSLVGISKQIWGMKYVTFAEGLSFVALSTVLCHLIGLTGLLLAALICNLLVTGSYSIKRTASYFSVTHKQVLEWIKRPARLLLPTSLLAAISFLPLWDQITPTTRLLIGSSIATGIILPLTWLFGIDGEVRLQIKNRIVNAADQIRSRARPGFRH